MVDGCAILWVINWPTNGTLSDYVGNFCDFIFLHLQSNDTSVVFDKYHDFIIKSSTRADRGKFSSRTHMMTLTSPLPPKSSVLTSASCKVQIIKHVTEGLLQRAVAGCYANSLVIAGLSETPTEVSHGVAVQRQDLRTLHEEANLMMVRQAYKAVLDYGADSVYVLCDDTDLLVLLCYFFWKLHLSCKVYMQGTSSERIIYDIKETVEANKEIMPSIVSAHALSGCDSVAPYHGVGKLSIIKRLKEGMKLLHVGCLNEDFGKALVEATTLVSDCYGYPDVSMTQCRIKVWHQKTSKARKKAPDLQSLPPTSEAFKENVKRAHLQAIVWYSTMEAESPAINFTDYGWNKDELNKVLAPVGLFLQLLMKSCIQ